MVFIVSLNLRRLSWRPRTQFPLGFCKQNKAVTGIILPSSTMQVVEKTTISQPLHNMPVSCGTDMYGPRYLWNAQNISNAQTNSLLQPRAPPAPSAVGAALGWCEGTSVTTKCSNFCQHAWHPLLHLICSRRHGENEYQSTWIMEMDNGAHVLALWQGRASACQLPHPVVLRFS